MRDVARLTDGSRHHTESAASSTLQTVRASLSTAPTYLVEIVKFDLAESPVRKRPSFFFQTLNDLVSVVQIIVASMLTTGRVRDGRAAMETIKSIGISYDGSTGSAGRWDQGTKTAGADILGYKQCPDTRLRKLPESPTSRSGIGCQNGQTRQFCNRGKVAIQFA